MTDNTNAKCWICGAPATSREHLIKASDMKLYFPGISQNNPVYKHSHKRKNILIGSRKSDQLKSDAPVCKKCNNQVTQPYDKAWQCFSSYIYENRDLILSKKSIDLKKIYPTCSRQEIVFLQLYLLKLFGCLLLDGNCVNNFIVAKEFANSILKQSPRDDVFLSIVKQKSWPSQSCLISDLECSYDNFNNDNLVRARWFLGFNEIVIHIEYCHSNYIQLLKQGGWNPTNSTMVIDIIVES